MELKREERMARTRQEEGIVLISGWVLLGLKQGVKVPEGALNEVVGWHLCEATQSSEFILCSFCDCVGLCAKVFLTVS